MVFICNVPLRRASGGQGPSLCALGLAGEERRRGEKMFASTPCSPICGQQYLSKYAWRCPCDLSAVNRLQGGRTIYRRYAEDPREQKNEGRKERPHDVLAALDPVPHAGEPGDVVGHHPQVLAAGPASLARFHGLEAQGHYCRPQVGHEAVLYHVIGPAPHTLR